MPNFTITVSDKLVAQLQLRVAAYNKSSGQSLTVKQWILHTLKEIAIQHDLSSAHTESTKQREQEARANINTDTEAERQRLLSEL